MSRQDEREIARRLADTPAGEPPPELLERLRADIPEDLAAGLEAGDEAGGPPAAPTPFSRRWVAAAATLVMLLAGGFLAWKLTQEVGPVGESYVDGPPAAESTMDASGSTGRVATPGTTEPTESAKATAARADDPAGEVAEEEPPRDESRGRAATASEAAPVGQAFEDTAIHEERPMEEVTVTAVAPSMETAYATVHGGSGPSDPPPHRLARPSVPPPPLGEAERRRRNAAQEPALQTVELEVVAEPVERAADDQALDLPETDVKAELSAPTEPPTEPPPPTNPVVETAVDRLSTFGLDVDTGSFTLLRAYLEAGRMPPAAAVRVEEVVNAQPFSDPFAQAPARPGETFRVTADGAPSPFTPDRSHRLLRFRVSARELPPAERKPVVLTLVVDISGSMNGERLELVRTGLERLLASLRPGDRVALVTFSDDARLVAPHGQPEALARASEALGTEGGTNAEAGLVLGYDTARQAFDPAAVNRVVLLSDGVANIGATGPEAILERVAAAAADGIELTTVGVGMGDFNDRMMETLADRGDGRYAYADDRREMERLFAEELDGTLQTVAEEARAQVEFDPRVVESWRQVGYENRAIDDHEFRYDAVDAGEIGPGHSVTALYEVKLRAEPAPGRPLALLKLRWREPAAADGIPGGFREIEERLTAEDLAASWSSADPDLRLAAVAAELAEHLRGSPHATSAPSILLTEARRLAAAGVPGAAELVELAEAWRRLDVPAADAEKPGAD